MHVNDAWRGASLVEMVTHRPGPIAVNWTCSSTPEILDHITSTYHFRIAAELPALRELLARVTGEHQEDHPELPRVRATYEELSRQVVEHLHATQDLMFPMCRHLAEGHLAAQFACGGVQNPVRLRQLAHAAIRGALATLRTRTAGYQVPDGACPSLHATFGRLGRLERELLDLIRLESEVLYPKVVAIGAGRLCEDWTH